MKNKLNSGSESQKIKDLEEELIFYKTLLTNIYKASDYLGIRAEQRANDLSRDSQLRAKDTGSMNAYNNIVQMVLHYDTIGSVDYYKVNDIVKDLPNILK